MFYQGALYHCHTLVGELEEVLQFIVPTANQVAAMNGCHRGAGHQGQQELLHIDFTSIEMTMELDQPPNMLSISVFYDHFAKHIMAYMTLNQTAKTVA